MLEGVRVDPIGADEHEVVVEERSGVSSDLECLIAASSGDNSVGRGNGGDDVLDDALGERPSDAFYLEFLCAIQGLLVQPVDVIGVIVVDFLV